MCLSIKQRPFYVRVCDGIMLGASEGESLGALVVDFSRIDTHSLSELSHLTWVPGYQARPDVDSNLRESFAGGSGGGGNPRGPASRDHHGAGPRHASASCSERDREGALRSGGACAAAVSA